MDPLERSLLSSLAFFDLFSRPLTVTELWRLRHAPVRSAPASLGEVVDCVERMAADGRIGRRGGLVFLPGREETVAVRQRRARLSLGKMRRARLAARLFGLLPTVRMVAVCNSLAIENADEESDIDLLIVARPGTLWLTRFLLAGSLALLGLRPTAKQHANRLCLGFFVSEDAADVSRAMLGADDVYFLYWAATLVPLHDAGGVAEAFFARNAWVRDSLPSWSPPLRVPGAASQRLFSPPRPAGRVLAWLDRLAERLQRRLFPGQIRELLNVDTRVIADGGMLKFHAIDRRAEFRDAFLEKLASLEAAREQVTQEIKVPA